MSSILKVSEISKWRRSIKGSICLVGGCFDILHPGHIIFLEKAKRVGDILVVLLESDQKIKKIKGSNRPIHTQKERAKILSALRYVDFVLMLPFMENIKDYDELILKIKPDVIAVAKGGQDTHHQRSAKLVGAKLKYVTRMVKNYSTSQILSQQINY